MEARAACMPSCVAILGGRAWEDDPQVMLLDPESDSSHAHQRKIRRLLRALDHRHHTPWLLYGNVGTKVYACVTCACFSGNEDASAFCMQALRDMAGLSANVTDALLSRPLLRMLSALLRRPEGTSGPAVHIINIMSRKRESAIAMRSAGIVPELAKLLWSSDDPSKLLLTCNTLVNMCHASTYSALTLRMHGLANVAASLPRGEWPLHVSLRLLELAIAVSKCGENPLSDLRQGEVARSAAALLIRSVRHQDNTCAHKAHALLDTTLTIAARNSWKDQNLMFEIFESALHELRAHVAKESYFDEGKSSEFLSKSFHKCMTLEFNAQDPETAGPHIASH